MSLDNLLLTPLSSQPLDDNCLHMCPELGPCSEYILMLDKAEKARKVRQIEDCKSPAEILHFVGITDGRGLVKTSCEAALNLAMAFREEFFKECEEKPLKFEKKLSTISHGDEPLPRPPPRPVRGGAMTWRFPAGLANVPSPGRLSFRFPGTQ